MTKILQLFTSDRNKGILALLLLALLWGFTSILPRFLEDSFTSLQQTYLRCFIAFLFSYVFFRKDIRIGKISKLGSNERALILGRSLIYYALSTWLYVVAVSLTKVSNVAFVSAIPFSALLGFILLREKFTLRKGFLVAMSFVGAVIIGVKSGVSIASFGIGESIAMLSGFLSGLGLVTRKWHTNKLNDKEISTYMLFLGSGMIFVFSILSGESLPTFQWTSEEIILTIVGGLITAGTGFFINYGLSKVDAVLSSTLLNSYPLATVILGAIFLRELPGGRELLGGAIIIGSIYALGFMDAKGENKQDDKKDGNAKSEVKQDGKKLILNKK